MSRFNEGFGGAVVIALLGCASPQVPAATSAGTGQMSSAVSTLETPESRDRIKWLRSHASPLRSVDPADEDFADLAPLGRAIGDARVVFLGEASHGEGSAYLGKTRLVKYLHQKLGFDVLVFESGLYEGPKVWDALRGGGSAVSAIAKGVLPAWSWSGEIEPLAGYLAAQSRGARPLYYAGFDPQLTGRGSLTSRTVELRAFLDTLGLFGSFAADSLLWRGLAWSQATKDSLASDSMSVERFAAATTRLGAALASRSNEPSSHFWQQVLQSAAANARQQRQGRIEMTTKDTKSWASSNTRDEQGARNMLWLANDRYRGHRLIVWSATIHAVRNVASIDTRDTALSYANYITTGHHVWKALGSQVYTLGFVALTGSVRLGPDSWQITTRPTPEVQLEELIGAAGFETAFLDYRHIARGGEWLRGPLLSRPIAEHAKMARWNEVLDGIVFLREMKPATWPDFEARLRGAPPGP